MRLILGLLSLALAACSSSEREPAQPSMAEVKRPPAGQEQDTRPVIVAFGDSLSEGLGVEPRLSFPDQLQRLLDSRGYMYRVINMGISGDTTTGGLGRVDSIAAVKPEIVVLELGGNDGLRGIPVAATKSNLEAIIVKLQSEGAQVLLAGMTLPPNYGRQYIGQFEAAYKDLAKKYKLKLIPFLMEDIARNLAATPGLMQRDGIHPTAAGHKIIADTVFRYMQPLLKKP